MPPPVAKVFTAAPEKLLALTHATQVEPDTVHVWSFILEGPSPFVALCRSYLSAEERERADRFVFDRDRIRYTVAHAVLRHLLGRCCGLAPESLTFSTTPAGKPSLQIDTDRTWALHFNLSHSDNRGLLGVSPMELGVDVEKVRSDVETLAISRHYFFGSERDSIEAAPSHERDNAFFRYWVAKEAVLKAQGIGLGFPLDRFRVDFHPDGDRAHIETLDPAALQPQWHIRMLPCEPGWCGAVAARGSDWVVKLEQPDSTDS
jgi:4'-phosphopantetheinyl transferase